MKPRDDQIEFVTRAADAFRRNRAVLGVSPCGSGKTLMTALMATRAVNKGHRPIITVPRVDLIRQTARTFTSLGVPFGLVRPGKPTPNDPILLGTMQTIGRRQINANFIINDEAHYGLSPAWAEYLQTVLIGGGWVLGLTASPIPGMDSVYGEMVEGRPVSWHMRQGHLSDYRAYAPAQPDLSKLPIHGGDYAPGPAGEFMSKPSITGEAVGHWLKFAAGKRTIGYAVSREASRAQVAAFISAGIPAEHIDGDTPHEERLQIAARFARRETRVLMNVALFQLGYDLSSQVDDDVPIEAMIDQGPTKSLPLQVQKWGRVMRRKPDDAIILDHANNFRDLGVFPDSDMAWSIAKGVTRKGEQAIPVSICTLCFAAFRTAPVCPYCRAPRQLTPREIEQKEGELAEIRRHEETRARKIQVAMATRDENPIIALAKVAKEKNYKPGWVLARLKIKKIKFDPNTVWAEIHRAMR